MVSLSGKPPKNLSVYDEIFRDFTAERRTCMIPTLERGSFTLSRWRRHRRDPAQHAAKQPPRHVALRQQQPVVAGVFNQTASGFHQPCCKLVSDQLATAARSASRQAPRARINAKRFAFATIELCKNHSDSSGLARSLVLSFSRVAAARRIPVLPHVLQRNSAARARHARGNDRKIRPRARACHYLVQDSINGKVRS